MLFATWNLLEWDAADVWVGPVGPASVHQRRVRVVEVLQTLALTAREAGEGLVGRPGGTRPRPGRGRRRARW